MSAAETLPPWESDEPKEQEAFKQWALDQLEALAPFTAASLKGPPTSDDEIHYWFARHKFEKAKRLLPRLTWPAFQRYNSRTVSNPHETRGRKPGPVAAVLDDDEKLSWLFRQAYGEDKYRRHKKPTREDILRELYSYVTDDGERRSHLTEDEWGKVASKLNWTNR